MMTWNLSTCALCSRTSTCVSVSCVYVCSGVCIPRWFATNTGAFFLLSSLLAPSQSPTLTTLITLLIRITLTTLIVVVSHAGRSHSSVTIPIVYPWMLTMSCMDLVTVILSTKVFASSADKVVDDAWNGPYTSRSKISEG